MNKDLKGQSHSDISEKVLTLKYAHQISSYHVNHFIQSRYNEVLPHRNIFTRGIKWLARHGKSVFHQYFFVPYVCKKGILRVVVHGY